jgi:hypothetical protein
MKFYIFNVTNPQQVKQGQKPSLKQVGPYSYRKYKVHFDVSFSNGGNELQYREWEYFEFDPSTSFYGANPEGENLTVINVPHQAVFGALLLQDTGVNGSNWWKALFFDTLASLSGSDLFTQVTPQGLIFGYKDPLLETLSKLQNGAVNPYFQL